MGSRIQVRPGERIPLDGNVLSGESAVDESLVTGESLPADKEAGGPVFAGTINGDGALVVEVTKEADQTALARITQLVGQTHARRAPSEQWVDRFARVYTPAVMTLALLVAAVPPLILDASFSAWLYRGLVLLVIACPCALVISTPVSIVAGLTAAARHGVLIKGGVYLEAVGRVAAIALDKTGTLTQGRPSVVEVAALDGHSEAHVLARAAAMEVHSGHPLARAIVAAARERGVAFEPADIALLSEDLRRIPWLVQHGRATLRVIRQNIFASLTVKAIFVLLAVFGSASLWAAIAADTGASLLVTFNGLRLARLRL